MITVYLPMEQVLFLLGLKSEDNLFEVFHGRQTVKLNGVNVMIVNYSDYIIPGWGFKETRMVRIDLNPIRFITPKEQLDAEEAVEKAKASLEAAKKVLESVKGKNN